MSWIGIAVVLAAVAVETAWLLHKINRLRDEVRSISAGLGGRRR